MGDERLRALRGMRRAYERGATPDDLVMLIDAALAAAEAAPLDVEPIARHFEDRLIPGVTYTREFIVGAIREYGRAALRSPDTETAGEADPEYHEHVAGDKHSHAFNGPHSHGGVSALSFPEPKP
jgi:hypothetical protein